MLSVLWRDFGMHTGYGKLTKQLVMHYFTTLTPFDFRRGCAGAAGRKCRVSAWRGAALPRKAHQLSTLPATELRVQTHFLAPCSWQ